MTKAAAPRRSLGHGIGLRSRHYTHLLEHGPGGADWFEVISENFFEPGGRPWVVLDRVRAERPIVLHGVSLCIGDDSPLSETYVASLVHLANRTEPAWISDHLCWGSCGGHYGHDLWPLPYTEEALDVVVPKVIRLQDLLGRAILLENVSSYVAFAASRIPEWQFVNEVATRSGCGILLDVNNVHVSARNHGESAEEYIDSIDASRVGQVHLAGHTDMGTHLFDTHVGPVPDVVWTLYRRFLRRAGSHVPTLVEWDEDVPEYDALVAEAARARTVEEEELPNG